jgi:hypothetical protein
MRRTVGGSNARGHRGLINRAKGVQARGKVAVVPIAPLAVYTGFWNIRSNEALSLPTLRAASVF